MDKFLNYLNRIEQLIKNKKHDEAWRIANEGLLELAKDNNEMWFAMYYQMAIILAREKKWQNALEKMGYLVYYLKGVGGATHEKFILRLLKKIKKEDKFKEYIKLAIQEKPQNFGKSLSDLLK